MADVAREGGTEVGLELRAVAMLVSQGWGMMLRTTRSPGDQWHSSESATASDRGIDASIALPSRTRCCDVTSVAKR